MIFRSELSRMIPTVFRIKLSQSPTTATTNRLSSPNCCQWFWLKRASPARIQRFKHENVQSLLSKQIKEQSLPSHWNPGQPDGACLFWLLWLSWSRSIFRSLKNGNGSRDFSNQPIPKLLNAERRDRKQRLLPLNRLQRLWSKQDRVLRDRLQFRRKPQSLSGNGCGLLLAFQSKFFVFFLSKSKRLKLPWGNTFLKIKKTFLAHDFLILGTKLDSLRTSYGKCSIISWNWKRPICK